MRLFNEFISAEEDKLLHNYMKLKHDIAEELIKVMGIDKLAEYVEKKDSNLGFIVCVHAPKYFNEYATYRNVLKINIDVEIEQDIYLEKLNKDTNENCPFERVD